jgi:alcohol dehydrogenase
MGATTYDPTDPAARKAVLAASGGVYGVCDFVGSDSSLAFATSVLAKGGKVVVTGLLGGAFTTAVAMFPMKAMTIEGTLTGTLAEAQELLALARAGKIPPIPIRERPLAEAQAALDDLRAGKVVGRLALTA